MGVEGNMEGEVRAEGEVEVDHVALDFVQSSDKDSRDKDLRFTARLAFGSAFRPLKNGVTQCPFSRLGLDIYNAFSAIKFHRNQKTLVNLAMQSIIYVLNVQNKNRQ